MWHIAKMLIKDMTGLSDQVLHLTVGTLFYLGLVIAIRRPYTALAVVFTLQITNEIVDLIENLNGAGLSGAFEDTALTLMPAMAIALCLSEFQRALLRPA